MLTSRLPALSFLSAKQAWDVAVQGQEYREGGMGEQGEAASRSSDVEVLVVRCVERELDNLQGKLKATAWNALLTATQSLRVLQVSLLRVLPCVMLLTVSVVAIIKPRQ